MPSTANAAMVLSAARTDIAERLVPGHWEGDHIKGQGNRSQIGTLVERTTLYVALVQLDNGTAQSLGTRSQRKYQWLAAAVSAKGI